MITGCIITQTTITKKKCEKQHQADHSGNGERMETEDVDFDKVEQNQI